MFLSWLIQCKKLKNPYKYFGLLIITLAKWAHKYTLRCNSISSNCYFPIMELFRTMCPPGVNIIDWSDGDEFVLIFCWFGDDMDRDAGSSGDFGHWFLGMLLVILDYYLLSYFWLRIFTSWCSIWVHIEEAQALHEPRGFVAVIVHLIVMHHTGGITVHPGIFVSRLQQSSSYSFIYIH